MSTVVNIADYRKPNEVPEPFRPHRHFMDALAHCKLADATSEIAWCDYCNAKADFGKDSSKAQDAYSAYTVASNLPRVIATSRAMMTPAPDLKAYRWKLKARKHGGGSPVWDAAIEADRLRLKIGGAK